MDKIITKEYVKTLLPVREQNSHKGTFGSVLNIAGSINYRGAAVLSAKSILKIGAGYVELAAVKEVTDLVSVLCPEAVFIPLKQKYGTIKGNEYKKILKFIPKVKTLLMGCGLSSLDEKQIEIEKFIKNLLLNIKKTKITVVLDADALNIIARLNIKDLPQKSIITPHPFELSRLLEIEVSNIQSERVKYAKEAAQKYKSIVVLKGQNTVVTDGEEIYINKTGNSALAKAGTGDVLSGIIAGLCAQGVEPFNAAILGVYLHGLSGEIASEKLTQYSVNALELIDFIPFAISEIIV